MLPSNSPYAHASRMPPPVRPSRSLEGLEQVIPPQFDKTPFTPSRSELFLNKPLPAMPFEEPEYSGMWSDSDSDSTVDSIASPSESRLSTESYPIFVSSGSDDFDLADHPTPADPLETIVAPQHLLPPRTDSFESNTSALTSKTDAQYGRPSQWSQNRPGTNHYFREKKWDFFPELATPGALPAPSNGRVSPGLQTKKTRKKEGRLNVSMRRRFHSLDRPGIGLAQARDSFKTYVHRTLSRDSPDTKAKEPQSYPRPSTAPSNELAQPISIQQKRGFNAKPLQSTSLDAKLNMQMRSLSLHTVSTTSASDMPDSPRSPRPKQLAVPMSPYQKYGPAIWESPKKSKKPNLRIRKQPVASRSTSHLAQSNPTPPLSPPLKTQLQQNTRDAVRVLQDGTSHMLIAFDGAKKKMSEAKDERRRELLKSQIKLVGPVNPHTCSQADPWL